MATWPRSTPVTGTRAVGVPGPVVGAPTVAGTVAVPETPPTTVVAEGAVVAATVAAEVAAVVAAVVAIEVAAVVAIEVAAVVVIGVAAVVAIVVAAVVALGIVVAITVGLAVVATAVAALVAPVTGTAGARRFAGVLQNRVMVVLSVPVKTSGMLPLEKLGALLNAEASISRMTWRFWGSKRAIDQGTGTRLPLEVPVAGTDVLAAGDVATVVATEVAAPAAVVATAVPAPVACVATEVLMVDGAVVGAALVAAVLPDAAIPLLSTTI